MGQVPSSPIPGTKFRVIGAGLPRTGTTSLSAAISHLLGGPVYHGGTELTLAPPHVIQSWIHMYKHTPIRSLRDKEIVYNALRSGVDGYVGAVDGPIGQFIPEMLEIYPDAIVVCTVREREAWKKSMLALQGLVKIPFLELLVYPLSTVRHFMTYLAGQSRRYHEVYGYDSSNPDYLDKVWDAHIEYLKREVPEEKLLFFDVREGWGPLCAKLGCEVPQDMPFPRVNDTKAVAEFTNRLYRRALLAWSGIIGAAGVACMVGLQAWKM